mgnify:FL=1
MPLISFIITYYDEPLPLLAECVRSVLRVRAMMTGRGMSEGAFEIIVVYDGSMVSPEDALRQMDRGIRYIRQENQGLSAARNAGLALARGEYVQFVDADDALLPRAYCSLCPRSALDADIILFRFTTRVPQTPPAASGEKDTRCPGKAATAVPKPMESGTEYLLRHNMRASACCYLFRRSRLGKLRFATGLTHEDELFTPLLLLRMHSTRDIPAAAYYYRQRTHSITHTHTSQQRSRRLDDLMDITRRLRNAASTLPPLEKAALTRRVEQLTGDYIYNVYRLECDPARRSHRMATLAGEHLLPLPVRTYTPGYWLYSLMLRLPHPWPDCLMRLLTHKTRLENTTG